MVCNFVSIILSIIHLWIIIYYDKSSSGDVILIIFESFPNMVIFACSIIYIILLSKGTTETGKFIISEFILFVGYSLVVIFIILILLIILFSILFECISSTIEVIDDRNINILNADETEIMLDETEIRRI